MHSLKTQGIIQNLKRTNIKVLQFANSNNLLQEFCDPFLIGHFVRKQYSSMVEGIVSTTPEQQSMYPAIARSLSGTQGLQLLYQHDIAKGKKINPSLNPRVFSPDLSVYFSVDFLEKTLASPPKSLSIFRQKLKNVKIYREEGDNLNPIGNLGGPNSMSFEINIFNLLGVSPKNVILVRDLSEYALYRKGKNAKEETLDQAVDKLKKKMKVVLGNLLKKDLGKNLKISFRQLPLGKC